MIANEMANVRYDKYPVSDGHMLIITHRHVSNYFEFTPEERIAMFESLEEAKLLLDKERYPDGYYSWNRRRGSGRTDRLACACSPHTPLYR